MIGVVKWFDPIKGYGFIEHEDEEVYVHYSAIIDQDIGERNLIQGEIVRFQLIETRRGLRAKNVCTLKSS